MRTLRFFCAVLIAVALVGCAGPTPYQSNGFAGGYRDQQLGPDTLRVIAAGNIYTSQERAENIALLRAAELALQNGFPYFLLLGEPIRREHVIIERLPATVSITSNTTASAVGPTVYSTTSSAGTITPGRVIETPPSPEVTLEFKGLKVPEVNAVNASKTAEALRVYFK